MTTVARPEPRASVLIPSWNGRQHLVDGLPALLAERRALGDLEIVVLDNGSTDGTAELVAEHFPEVRLLRAERNLGFAAGSNRLAESAQGELLLFVNNDMRVEPGWAASLLATLAAAAPDVAAVGGRIVDWEGERLDFGRGVATFDGHALALDQGRPLAAARLPASGEELLFGCGGNLLVRREVFRALGGFDEAYFAYFEDVDLGWRLWAAGHRVVACAEAVARHRRSASSARLGNRGRGLLFERNALWTAFKNLEPGLWERLLPTILLTYLSRLEAMVGEETPLGLAPSGLPGGASRQWPKETLARKLRRNGPGGLVRRAAARALRAVADRIAPRSAALQLGSDRTIAQLGALAGLFDDLPGLEARRRATQHARRRPDGEILARFPLWIVPAYPGDERLFASQTFRELLPGELRFEYARLDEVVAPRAGAGSADLDGVEIEARRRR
jgi:GT2 family glycosyltransferase